MILAPFHGEKPEGSQALVRKAANQGNLVGQLNYAQKLLAEGMDSDNRESILKARDWFKKALRQDPGLKEAVYGIGLSYVKIPGVKRRTLARHATG